MAEASPKQEIQIDLEDVIKASAGLRYGSVCSGIEAATVAWHTLGWLPQFFAEIETFPSAVLAHHYPDVPNHGDMTKFKDWPDADLDVLVGGTPCQSFSVAGLRKGMADPRGNLALTYLAIADRYRPKWLVWENVPGVLSSNEGRDFGSILGGMVELGYGFAYRVLDAQYIRVDGFPRAVPQRRRRVFVVGHLGNWRRAAAVLFDRESLCGNSAPRRQAGQGFTYDAAPCLTSSGRGVERTGETRGQDPLVAFGGGNCSGPIDVATAHTAHTAHGGSGRFDFESETFVAHALRAEGFDASEDGTGRGTPLVPVSATLGTRSAAHTSGVKSESEFLIPVAGTLQCGKKSAGSATRQDAMSGLLVPTIAFSCKDHGADAVEEVAPTLRAMNHTGSHANAGGQMAVSQGWRVRRLTPRECERLQGFPDGYTQTPYRSKEAADGPRYKALGNSMAVNCMRWVGQRIQLVEALS